MCRGSRIANPSAAPSTSNYARDTIPIRPVGGASTTRTFSPLFIGEVSSTIVSHNLPGMLQDFQSPLPRGSLFNNAELAGDVAVSVFQSPRNCPAVARPVPGCADAFFGSAPSARRQR